MIILVRHGQTFWNVERRVQGQSESELTPLGERQAVAMAALVADLLGREPSPLWRLVSSPLGRARQTADAVAQATRLPVEIDARLAEIRCGGWEGQLWDEIRRDDPDKSYDGERFFRSPGGESFEDVMGRAAGWLADLPPEPARRVIAVSHGVWGRLLRGAYARLGRQTTLDQDVPQDAVFTLAGGRIQKHDCEPVEAA